MRFEIDSSIYLIEYLDDEEDIKDIKCVNHHQFYDLLDIILTESQHIRFIDSDGIYNISKKRYLAGVEYMKDNIWNKK